MTTKQTGQTRSLLLRHYKKYPLMRLEDAVKLLYQSEFAGGHMIEDEALSLERLRQEAEALCPRAGEEAFEDIGGGLCRLNLRGIDRLGVDVKTVNRFFVRTANSMNGSIEGFERKLDVLLDMCRGGRLPFDARQAGEYIGVLKANGYPAVSHSEDFRKAYAPAYRVVKSAYRDYIKVFAAADRLLKEKETVTIAIDGNCGSGKSALAKLIGGVYDCNVFHMDDFFLRPEQRTKQRLCETGGNIDYERFAEEVIEGIKGGREFTYRRYDCSRQELAETVTVVPKRLSVVEGTYSMHPSLIGFYDVKIFLSIDAKTQSARIFERSGEALHKRFLSEWIPMENKYFKKMEIKKKADISY